MIEHEIEWNIIKDNTRFYKISKQRFGAYLNVDKDKKIISTRVKNGRK